MSSAVANGAPPSLLLVDDDRAVRDGLAAVLRADHRVTVAEDGETALRELEAGVFDLVLLDVNLPRMTGLDVLAAGRPLQTDAQFLMMTGYGVVSAAVEAMKLGAYDFLNKPIGIPELLLKLGRALEEREMRREMARLRGRAGGGARARIVGRSPAMERLFALIERVAPSRATVLVTGETGTGKELVARAIHELSDRARRPFVAVNCGALPETLLESELFGHVRGAFTGAVANRRGLFEEAAGGTLFLDEIATVSPATQVRLLRVLQERTVQRVGGGAPVPVDFRLVAAANVDLRAEVEARRFREDLFYRLAVFPVHVPPLRERAGDLPLLAAHFRQRFAAENGVDAPAIGAEAMARMTSYAWPGNVRELENYIERAVILHAGAPSLPFESPRGRAGAGAALLNRAEEELWDLDRLEREYILAVLERTGGRMGAAAESLGIDVRTLNRKLNRYRELGIVAADGAGNDG